MKTLNKIKETGRQTVTTTRQVYDGAYEIVLATALVIVSTYNAYDLLIRNVGNFEFYTRAASSGLIGLAAAIALIRVFKAIGEKKG